MGSKLADFMNKGYITFPSVLFENIGRFDIDLGSMYLVCVLWHLYYKENVKEVNEETLSKYLGVNEVDIMMPLMSTIEKSLLSMESNEEGTTFLIEPLISRVNEILLEDLGVKRGGTKKVEKPVDSFNQFQNVEPQDNYQVNVQKNFEPNPEVQNQSVSRNLFEKFESEFKKVLSPYDIDYIKEWVVEDHFSEAMILDALRVTVKNCDKPNFQYIDKVLKNWSANGVTSEDENIKLIKGKNQKNSYPSTGSKRNSSKPENNGDNDKYEDLFF